MNVLYKTAAEKYFLLQIYNLDVLNQDFNGLMAISTKFQQHFQVLKANVGISFVLDAVYRNFKNFTRTRDANEKIKSRRN